MFCARSLILCFLFIAVASVQSQTRLNLSTIIPGSERVQLVNNGDFQSQGPAEDGEYPSPLGWNRMADMFTGQGVNLTLANGAVVALGRVDGGAGVSMYSRSVRLEPNTSYVLSAYMWNFGSPDNSVVTVVDLNDAKNEPQLYLSRDHSGADQGYFVFGTFNTADTGSNVVLRVFYDGRTGSGAAPEYFPVGAQWDNIALTRADEFIPPQPSGSGANMRPFVSICSPADGESLFVETVPAMLPLTANAADLDGTVTRVDFYADTNKVAQVSTSPYSVLWSNVSSGSFRLTAVATDDRGAATVSAPVFISATILPQPVSLRIESHGSSVLVSWPTSATASSLQCALNLSGASPWKVLTNAPVLAGAHHRVTLAQSNSPQFFRLGAEVDPSTLNRKLLMGYQGWFACPQDGSPINQWVHWFRRQNPVATNATFDFWPDMSELDPDELFPTGLTLSNGSPAMVFSAYNRKTVMRHVKWMKDHHLDGVFLQRFSSSLGDSAHFAFRNQVTGNARAGAEAYGRVFAMMYDISGQNPATLVRTLTNDWNYLVNTLRMTNSPAYVWHKGKPVVAIWGFGFTDRPGTPQDAQTVINFFKAAGCTVMGGVPTQWRTLKGDSQTNTAWAAVYRSFDIISPWSVGRYGNISEIDAFRQNQIQPDLVETRAKGIDYMPVIFPGFSWTNLNQGPFNQIPRNGGSFYWRQALNAISAGCTMLYGAMYDEVDEGTAMFKLVPTNARLPVEGSFVPLDVDGQSLPSDWYLRVADQASRMLRQEIPLQGQLPIRP